MALVPEGPPKWCPECGAFRPRSEFYGRRAANGVVYALKLCKTHTKLRVMASQRANRERTNANHRRFREARRRDPERLALHRDYQRTWARQKLGITPDRYRVEPSVRDAALPPSPPVDAAPFAAWLNTLGPDAAAIARACGMKERHVRRILNGETTTVTLDTVDAALLAADTLTTLDDLLPLEEAA